MDISTFRWILVIAGIVIIGGIFLLGHPDKKRKPRLKRKQRIAKKRANASRVRREPVLNDTQPHERTDDADDGHDVRQAELAIDGPDHPEPESGERIEPAFGDKPRAVAAPMPDKIITLYLQARDNHVISGVDLLDAALKSGLVFGKHDIFHRIHEEDIDPVFSMANLIKPGSFDKSAWNTMEIRGVALFMTLPGPRSALDAWDSMLATSRRLAELLHADLLDESRGTFTRQRSMQIKEDLREYQRQNKKDS